MNNLSTTTITEKIFNHSPDMLCAIDKNGQFVKISKACRKLLGYDVPELVGKAYIDFVVPEDREITLQTAQNIMNGCSTTDFGNRYLHKAGKAVPVSWSATWSEEDELIVCVGRCGLGATNKGARENEKYKALFEHYPDLIYYESRDGSVQEVNRSFSEVFGCEQEEVAGRPASSFLPPAMASVNRMSLEQSLLGSTLRYDLELSLAEGESRIFDTVKLPVVVNGTVVGAQTIAKDITPIVRSYELVEQQAKRLNNILESITDAFFALDWNWRFTYVNSVFAEHEGYRKDEMIGKDIWEMFPNLVSSTFYRKCRESKSTSTPSRFEESFFHSGVTYRFKIYPSTEGLSVYFTDITKERGMQQELQNLSLVASHTDNGVIITDAAWRTEWVNEGFTKMMGYTLADMVGNVPDVVFLGPHVDRKVFKQLSMSLRSRSSVNRELFVNRKSGTSIWISIDISAIRDSNGNIVKHVAIQRDITFRKEAEAQLLKLAEDLRTQNSNLEQFTYIVSHNLRAPVANALGLASLMYKADRTSETFDTYLAYLKKSLVHMDTVLRDVNTVLATRENKGVVEKESVKLVDVIKQAISYLQEHLNKCKAEVSIEVEEQTTVNASSAYLFSVFYNLLTNAIKFRSSERPLRIIINQGGGTRGDTVVSFSDNGLGFDMQEAGKDVFKLYKKFHRKLDGRGVGLFLVKTHIEAMGGTIKVSSQVNVGTTFVIHLPGT